MGVFLGSADSKGVSELCIWLAEVNLGVFVRVKDKGQTGKRRRRSDKKGTYKPVFFDRGQKSEVMVGLAGLYEIEHDP